MKALLFAAALTLLALAGCGYHTPGTGDVWVGGEAQTLYVDLFQNRTTEPYLENYLSDAVVFQLSRSRMVALTEDRGNADLVLQGTIERFDTDAIAYNPRDRITEYRATMRVRSKLVRVADGKVLWQEVTLRTEDYPATVDKNLQLEGQDLAAREVAKRLAEDLYANMFNAF